MIDLVPLKNKSRSHSRPRFRGVSCLRPRTRGPGNSHVTPKQLTPCPRTRKVGSRFLETHLGRWISRDPAAGIGSLDTYDFVGNDAQDKVDMIGLYSFERAKCKCMIDGAHEHAETLGVIENLIKDKCLSDVTKDDANIYLRRGIGCAADLGHVGQYNCWALADLSATVKVDEKEKASKKEPEVVWLALVNYDDGTARSIPQYTATLRHELQHARDMCGKQMEDCADCYKKEARAYYCEGVYGDVAWQKPANQSLADASCAGLCSSTKGSDLEKAKAGWAETLKTIKPSDCLFYKKWPQAPKPSNKKK